MFERRKYKTTSDQGRRKTLTEGKWQPSTTKYNEIPAQHNQVPPNSTICDKGKGRKLERTMVPSISPMRRRTVWRKTENAEFPER